MYIGKNELLALYEFIVNIMGFIFTYAASHHKPSLINKFSDHEGLWILVTYDILYYSISIISFHLGLPVRIKNGYKYEDQCLGVNDWEYIL